jgi:hypothetical protein
MHIFEAKGNRFAFTSTYSYFLEDEPSLPESDCIFFAMNFGEITYTGECLNVPCVGDEIIFEHVKGEITSPLFFHGGATVYYLSGPIFDEIKLEEQGNKV